MASSSTTIGVVCASASNTGGVASSSTMDGLAWHVQVTLVAWRRK